MIGTLVDTVNLYFTVMRRSLLLFVLTLSGALAALLAQSALGQHSLAQPTPFFNLYEVAQDTGERPAPTYFFRRAWVQITRDLAATEVPPTVPLDLQAMAQRPFAVAWLGHAALLVRAGSHWILLDPALSGTAGPVQGLGPARLTPLPFAWDQLPHIDLVLLSHDHYDHLDLDTMRQLARQSAGPPRVMAGRAMAGWFAENTGLQVEEFDWWQVHELGGLRLRFLPAQHNSGRTLADRNHRLWGGWVLEHGGQRFYFAGDTAYVPELFRDIRERVGPIDLAALPIGAYLPRPLMRYEHMDPAEAVQAHRDLGATQSFGVHWGTFQLGDEEPFEAARDLQTAVRQQQVPGFGLLPVGGYVDVRPAGSQAGVPPAMALQPARASGPPPLVAAAR
jgi:N-acyl-phosphatidylethanolamine-hydrolysing phospholipase D